MKTNFAVLLLVVLAVLRKPVDGEALIDLIKYNKKIETV